MSKFYLGNPTNTLAVINRYEFAFQKKFGQNFLIDQGIVEKIVREELRRMITCLKSAPESER